MNEKNPPPKDDKASENLETKTEPEPAKTGGWGGWGFSPLSVLSDLQKAAQEISRNVSFLLLRLLLLPVVVVCTGSCLHYLLSLFLNWDFIYFGLCLWFWSIG